MKVGALCALTILLCGAARAQTATPTATPTPQGTPFAFCLTPGAGQMYYVQESGGSFCPVSGPTVIPDTLIISDSLNLGVYEVAVMFFRWLTGPTLANKHVTGADITAEIDTSNQTDDILHAMGWQWYPWTPATITNCFQCPHPDTPPCGSLGGINSTDTQTAAIPFTRIIDWPSPSAPFLGAINVNTGDGYTAGGLNPQGGPTGLEVAPTGRNKIEFLTDQLCLHVWAIDVTPTPAPPAQDDDVSSGGPVDFLAP